MMPLEMEMDKPLIQLMHLLSAIGGKTTGTVTVDNAVKIVGSQAQVTGTLVTTNTLVAAGTAVVSINDAALEMEMDKPLIQLMHLL